MTNHFAIGHVDSDSDSSKPIPGFKDGLEDLETSRIGLISGDASIQFSLSSESAIGLNSMKRFSERDTTDGFHECN